MVLFIEERRQSQQLQQPRPAAEGRCPRLSSALRLLLHLLSLFSSGLLLPPIFFLNLFVSFYLLPSRLNLAKGDY